jgi:hypothetical protein
MARKKKTPSTPATPGSGAGQRVQNPIEQRSPNNQATGGYDPEDYHGSGPVPVGEAPVHPQSPATPSIPMGVGLNKDPVTNPGDVPNTEAERARTNREALDDSVKYDETMKKASRKAS